jgi:RNA polymerase sigma factor for flagellar operon FliA
MSSEALWQAYTNGDTDARDALLREHLSLVHHVARQLSRTLASTAEFDELVSSGTIGLMSALESFELSRGLAFSTFAVPRIRGAILDELRRQDHVPRSVRRKAREVTHAREEVMRVNGGAASDADVAGRLGVDLVTLWQWQADTECAVHMSLDRPLHDDEGDRGSWIDALSQDDEQTIDEAIAREQEIEFLQAALAGLRAQERTVLTLYYFEELKLHEIAAMLGVTESRVSQVRTKALSRLREELAGLRATHVAMCGSGR